MQFNNAINPKDERDTIATTLMPCRSKRIKHVKPMPPVYGVGGMSDLKTGTVYIPSTASAFGRLARYHEALHIQFTPKTSPPRDILDQALEDARLHRYCSRASFSAYEVARRDELTTALRDFRAVLQFHAAAIHKPEIAVIALRGLAILHSSCIKPAHMTLCKRALASFGPSAYTDMFAAIDTLIPSDGTNTDATWLKARAIVAKYFAESYTPPTLDAPITPADTDTRPDACKPSAGAPKTDKPDTSDAPATDEKVFDPSAEETDKTESSKPADTDTDGESASTGDSDTGSDTGTDPAIESAPESTEPLDIPKALEPAKTRKSKIRHKADEYTADLTPACDAKAYADMQHAYPLKLFIRRLDMSINRVKLSLGRKSPMPVTSGRRILSGKLTAARTTPGTRVFARPIASGGFGTILIDASGSMAIPEQTLKKFLSMAPALTLAFYNAPTDSDTFGNIFVYAANGYRANVHHICAIPHYGHGNVIDYQVLAWLIKQPAPHYYVGDLKFTGPWREAGRSFFNKLKLSKQVIHVRTLDDMSNLLKQNARKGL